MKKKLFAIISLVVIVLAVTCFAFVGCTGAQQEGGPVQTTDGDGGGSQNGEQEEGPVQTLRFAAPEGTPALAMLRLTTDNKVIAGKNMTYGVVAPANIAVEMSTDRADIVIMPINAGANLIRQGAAYKLLSVAVNGSLFIVGNKADGNQLTIADLKGKKIACIGQTAVPGMVFRYVMAQNGITLITEGEPNAANNEVFVQYVDDGSAARPLLATHQVDFAMVGEPAATAFKNALSLNAELNLQVAYTAASGKDSYPQAGLFIKTSLAEDMTFVNALFTALKASKDWAVANPSQVTAYAKENLYESATFPAPSIARCAIDVEKLTETKKGDIVSFLNTIVPQFDWSTVALF